MNLSRPNSATSTLVAELHRLPFSLPQVHYLVVLQLLSDNSRRVHFLSIQLSSLILNASKDGTPIASLGNVFQCLTTLTVKYFLLISNLNFPFYLETISPHSITTDPAKVSIPFFPTTISYYGQFSEDSTEISQKWLQNHTCKPDSWIHCSDLHSQSNLSAHNIKYGLASVYETSF